MKARVFYHSSTGNTRKVAEAMARSLGTRAESLAADPGQVSAELLFLGGAVYATQDHGLHPALKAFIAGLDPARIGEVALFRTGFSDEALGLMEGLLSRKGIRVRPERFGCKGRFLLFNLGHPGPEDLRRAAAFASRLAGPKEGTL